MIRLVVIVLVAILLLLAPEGMELVGQATGGGAELGRQTLRPYLHVFVAYAVAWLLLLGWVVSIARRLGRVEEELEKGSGTEG